MQVFTHRISGVQNACSKYSSRLTDVLSAKKVYKTRCKRCIFSINFEIVKKKYPVFSLIRNADANSGEIFAYAKTRGTCTKYSSCEQANLSVFAKQKSDRFRRIRPKYVINPKAKTPSRGLSFPLLVPTLSSVKFTS